MRKPLSVVLLCAAAVMAGCATKPVTTLDVTWVSPQLPPPPTKLLIITVSGDESGQMAFQNQMATALKARGVNAVASHRYFTRYTDAERERFKSSIYESDADYVLVARITTTSDKALENRGYFVGSNGQPYASDVGIEGAAARYFNPSGYVAGADGTERTVTAEASVFATKDRKLIWSARTRTTNAQSSIGSEIAPQYTAVILEAMKKDKLF